MPEHREFGILLLWGKELNSMFQYKASQNKAYQVIICTICSFLSVGLFIDSAVQNFDTMRRYPVQVCTLLKSGFMAEFGFQNYTCLFFQPRAMRRQYRLSSVESSSSAETQVLSGSETDTQTDTKYQPRWVHWGHKITIIVIFQRTGYLYMYQ